MSSLQNVYEYQLRRVLSGQLQSHHCESGQHRYCGLCKGYLQNLSHDQKIYVRKAAAGDLTFSVCSDDFTYLLPMWPSQPRCKILISVHITSSYRMQKLSERKFIPLKPLIGYYSSYSFTGKKIVFACRMQIVGTPTKTLKL